MRTTIDLSDEQRARLLELAAQRRMKGFSALIQEAVDLYLAHHASHADRVREACAAIGTLDDDEAQALRDSVRDARRSWR